MDKKLQYVGQIFTWNVVFRVLFLTLRDSRATAEEDSLKNTTLSPPPDAGTFVFKDETSIIDGLCPSPQKKYVCTSEQMIKVTNVAYVPILTFLGATVFSKHGLRCNKSDHDYYWNQFHSGIWSILQFRQNAMKICSEYGYQTCGPDNLCTCGRGALYDQKSKKCTLVDGALDCVDDIGQILLNPPTSTQPDIILDSRACLGEQFAIKLECSKTSKCMCHSYPGHAIRTSFCNPKNEKGMMDNTKTLVKSIIEKAVQLNWTEFGSNCSVSDNFDARYTHSELKQEIATSFNHYFPKHKEMCNPFANLQCISPENKCGCMTGFIHQNGVCRLIVANYQEIDKVRDQVERHAVGENIKVDKRKICEWYPKFNFQFADHFDEYSEVAVNAGNKKQTYLEYYQNLIAESVPCVTNATCEKAANLKFKFCRCKEGMECAGTEPLVNMPRTFSTTSHESSTSKSDRCIQNVFIISTLLTCLIIQTIHSTCYVPV